MNSKPLKILLIDNYDSFTHNLKHLIESCSNVDLSICRNDDNFLSAIENKEYDGVVIGPGPGTPEDDAYFGKNKELILEHGTKGLPILGVCLGFQGIYHCFGGKLKLGDHPVHGKTSCIAITETSKLLSGLEEKSIIMRYHSILTDNSSVPDDIKITAYTYKNDSGDINYNEPMALEHKKHPIYGVQFHPESFATEQGMLYIKNFLDICH